MFFFVLSFLVLDVGRKFIWIFFNTCYKVLITQYLSINFLGRKYLKKIQKYVWNSRKITIFAVPY